MAYPRYPDVDKLLDRLHELRMCGGCPDCGTARLQGSFRDPYHQLEVTFPDGYSLDYIGRDLNETARKLLRAVNDRVKLKGAK